MFVVLIAGCTQPSIPLRRLSTVSDFNYHIGTATSLTLSSGAIQRTLHELCRSDRMEDHHAADRRLPALGKRTDELGRDMERALGKYVRDGGDRDRDRLSGPPSEQVRVIGEVSKPQALPTARK